MELSNSMAFFANLTLFQNFFFLTHKGYNNVSVRLFIAELVIIEKCPNINFAKAISDTKVTSYQSIGTMFGS
jgi:hypothetical protein